MSRQEQELSVARMWTGVPAAVFEHAPSSTGLFEREEISRVGEIISRSIETNGSNFLFLGSATAFREIAALRQARKLLDQQMTMNAVTAMDIAPQLLQIADKRLKRLQLFDVVKSAQAILGSVDQVNLDSKVESGIALLGVYDLDCFLNHGAEINGEPVALEEYGGGMKEILGSKTKILPLTFKHDRFSEEEPIIEYDCSSGNGDFSDIRETLRQYKTEHPKTVAMRIYINPENLDENHPNTPLFISTWFDLEQLTPAFESFDVSCAVHRTIARKGVVLEVKGRGVEPGKKFKNCALVMNNVFGNLATAEVMTGFLDKIHQICTPHSKG